MPVFFFFLGMPEMLADLKTTNLTLDPSSEKQTMKIRKLMLSFAVAAISVQHVSAQSNEHFTSGAAVRKLADSEDDSYNRYASSDESEAASADASLLAPTASSCSGSTMCDGYGPGSCGAGGCGAGNWGFGGFGLGSGCSLGGGCGRPNRNGWFTTETLLLFAADRSSPPLVMIADNEVNPLDGNVAFGGDLSTGVIPGYRISAGFYIDPCQRLGVGARVFGTLDRDNDYSVASADGTTSIGVPFFNPNLLPNPGQDAFVVAGNLPGGDPISTGSLQASESISMVGAEGSGYILLSRGCSHRFDLVAGYTFNQLRNSISQSFQSTNLLTGDGIVDGTVFQFRDRFATDNRFNGAHLGVLSSVVRNSVSLSTLAKVSFGNMRNSTTVSGSSTTTVPALPPVTGDGFFARGTNIGTITNDHFAFLPELGIKMGYAFRPNMELTLGYTLMMWSSVALAGDQIDPVIDATGTSGRPALSNRTTAFWMQSIDLGASWSY